MSRYTYNARWGEQLHFKNINDCKEWLKLYLKSLGVPEKELNYHAQKMIEENFNE